jgi:hypothetical protein
MKDETGGIKDDLGWKGNFSSDVYVENKCTADKV